MGDDDDYDPFRHRAAKIRLISRKANRKRRKIKSRREKHNAGAHRARDNKKEKRAAAIDETRIAR